MYFHTLRSQALAISLKYFKTYVTYIYILLSCVVSSFWTAYTYLVFQQKRIQNPFKHLRWSVFASTANYFKLLAVRAKHYILDAWRGSEYACVQIESNNVLCHHNKRLMGYFEFLYGLAIICLPLIIPEKLRWQHLFQNPVKAETHPLYFS